MYLFVSNDCHHTDSYVDINRIFHVFVCCVLCVNFSDVTGENITFGMSYHVSKCVYLNEELGTWQAEGCRVSSRGQTS